MMLRLAHSIERHLRRRIPLETLTAQMRPSECIEHLGAVFAVTGSKTWQRTIVIMPGARGDDPNLVHFRRLLRDDSTACVLARYPSWEALVAPGASLGTMADSVIDQIDRHAGTGPLILLGYSVGGEVAHEVACRLAARGEPAAFVGLLDAFVTSRVPFDLPFDQAPAARKRQPLSMRLGYRLGRLIHRWPRIERLIARFKGRVPLPHTFAFYLRHYMTLWVVWVIAENWTPNVLPSPITLFRARSHSETVPWDLGWLPYAPALQIEHVDGNHFSIVGGTHSSALAQTIRMAIDVALAHR